MAHIARLRPPAPAAARAWITPAAPVPFEELLIDPVDRATGLLEQAASGALALLSPEALTILCRALLVRLSDVALATFASEFALHRALRQPLPGAVRTQGDAAYRDFVAAYTPVERSEALAHYPQLVPLLQDICRSWAEGHGEMLARLQADWPELRRVFDVGEAPPVVSSLMPYRSDPHHGGRAVTLLGFANGLVLVYKPRSVAMERGLDALLDWANVCGYSQPFRRPVVIERDGYGWMAHVAATPCRSAAQVDAYYHRIGGLIALVTLFQDTDIHQENLVAAGEHPVIVDAETLLHPRLNPAFARALGPGAARDPAPGDFAEALDDCGFFPRPGQPDFSALGATGPVDTPFSHPRCTGVNSDLMSVEQVPYQAPRRENVPRLNGTPQHAADHIESILAGYGELIALALDHRVALLDIAESFAGCATRLVVRSTNTYGLLLNASLAPAMLRGDGARAALFGRLSVGAATSPYAPDCAGILDEERRALLRLDVPHLTRACDIAASGWPAPLDQVRHRIRTLCAHDLTAHRALLRERLERMPATSKCDMPEGDRP